MSPWISSLSMVALIAALLAGCDGGAPESPPESAPAPPADEPSETVSNTASEEVREGLPTQFESVEDEVDYYISRLPDRSFFDTYGGEEHPRPWYIAAERLGQIGEPAIPSLVSRLDTSDDYELMLVLYALMLASQDPALMADTDGDYVELGTVLDPRHNAENRDIALAWWQRHGWRWQ
ncbi:HEAT repeat domain-containing protein [Wenzhouxiangella sp. XN201]|uniref:HEAT repeat domain-containing protein n=1 Tax=Wenzhouxiangella sp. XN201 TaxID=2710755 RepID=UPI001F088E33|nr:HEAT repeat domain-containing protein [Wenzhouxiangella sp. XN201]